MRNIITLSVLISFLHIFPAYGQEIGVYCNDKPLNELLIDLRQKHDLQFSFDDEYLSQFKISSSNSYPSMEEVFDSILEGLPLAYEKSGDVYIIFLTQEDDPLRNYVLKGVVLEKNSWEPLSSSHISANGIYTATDVKGTFSYTFQGDSLINVRVSHLGYYVLDTVLVASKNHTLFLTPSVIGIKEVVLYNDEVEKPIRIGRLSGVTSINHKIAKYLPGNGDNSVFNLLRLQPGILAAGEQPNDITIWGSYEGTGRVIFDGFTLWNLNNFSDNISAVNPYIAKNIEVYKGGYDATLYDAIGGIVDIAGKSGNLQKPSYNFFLNNQTLNAMIEVPILKKSSLILGFRQTYHNVFGANDLKYIQRINETGTVPHIEAEPNYKFRDFNAKYSFRSDNGDLFYISLLSSTDNFGVDLSQSYDYHNLYVESKESNKQTGGAAFYGKTWDNGNTTDLKLSFSRLDSRYSSVRWAERKRDLASNVLKTNNSVNDVAEGTLELKNQFLLSENNKFTIGTALIGNEIVSIEDTSGYQFSEISGKGGRLNIYFQDRHQFNKYLSITGGFRYNYSSYARRSYLDPRVSLSLRITDNLKMNASWGTYHQFLVKSSIFSGEGNYVYTWILSDDKDISVLKSEHFVTGLSYAEDNFQISLESYYKTNSGLTRYVRYRNYEDIFEGISRSYGLDFYVKKDFFRHSAWLSYSLSKTEELFPYFIDNQYRRAPQDQRHEIKFTSLFNWNPFHFSISYVYGSGFPFYKNYVSDEYVEKEYNRLDASFVYRLELESFIGEIGLSVLNISDADNVKYNQFARIPIEQYNTIFINTDAISRTPMLYLKVEF